MCADYLGKDIKVDSEKDIVKVRNAVYKVSEGIGLNSYDRTKVATAASELARNIIEYVGEGRVVIIPLIAGKKGIQIVARDEGPGIDNLDEIMNGDYESKSGMGMGLIGAKRLSDNFEIKTGKDGTKVFLTKFV